MLLTTNALAMTRKVAGSAQFVMCTPAHAFATILITRSIMQLPAPSSHKIFVMCLHVCSYFPVVTARKKLNATASAFFTQTVEQHDA